MQETSENLSELPFLGCRCAFGANVGERILFDPVIYSLSGKWADHIFKHYDCPDLGRVCSPDVLSEEECCFLSYFVEGEMGCPKFFWHGPKIASFSHIGGWHVQYSHASEIVDVFEIDSPSSDRNMAQYDTNLGAAPEGGNAPCAKMWHLARRLRW